MENYRFAWLLILFLMTSAFADENVNVSVANSHEELQVGVLGLRVADIDGQLYHLGSGYDSHPVVMVFLNTHCPIARQYTPVLNDLYELAHANEMDYFGVFSDPGISLQEVRQYREEYNVKFPILFDASGDIYKRLSPEVTPEVFVVSDNNQVVYRGRVNNQFVSLGKQRTNITTNDLEDAMIALLENRLPEQHYAKPIGCIAPKWNDSSERSITYNKDIAPILNANCIECHRQGEVAPFALESYDDAKRWAHMIRLVTQEKIMPPWKPLKGYGDFRDERVLSDHQIQLIAQWVEQGAVEGKPEDLIPAPDFSQRKWPLGEPDLVVKVDEPFDVPAEGDDIYRYFVIPSKFKKDHPTIGLDYRPSDPTVVHHALMFMDYSGRARKRDKEDPGSGFSVFGPGNFMNSDMSAVYLTGWVPGMKPFALPKGTAMWVPKGGDVLLQVHYNLTGKATQEQGEVAFYFQEEYPQAWIAGLVLGTQDIVIPANDSNYQRHFYMNVPSGFHIIDVTPHMHYLGKSVYAQVTMPDGSIEPLIKIDDWDLRWQNRYTYRKPLYIPKDARIDVWYTYDNTKDNPANPHVEPETVRWGLRSEDEMAQFWLVIIPDDYYASADLNRTSRVSWFRDSSQVDVINEVNPFDSMGLNESIALLKTKNPFVIEDNKWINQAIDSLVYDQILHEFESNYSHYKNDIEAVTMYAYLLFTKALFGREAKEIASNLKLSEKMYNKALKLDKKYWRARMGKARLFKHAPSEMKLGDDAIDILEDLIAWQEKQVQQHVGYELAYKDLSYMHEQVGDYQLAEQVRLNARSYFKNDAYFD